MSAVEVVARFDLHGKVYPQVFVWQGQTYPIDSVGRRWQEETEEHILVMDRTGKVFELIFSRLEGLWRLKTIPGSSDPA
ncbi:MAG: hypothetical protein JSV61_02910 [Anaerolineales bacterium]|nr:MAG: hypothetical protein JSV61_02910 [Anaerolineales bacterium]